MNRRKRKRQEVEAGGRFRHRFHLYSTRLQLISSPPAPPTQSLCVPQKNKSKMLPSRDPLRKSRIQSTTNAPSRSNNSAPIRPLSRFVIVVTSLIHPLWRSGFDLTCGVQCADTIYATPKAHQARLIPRRHRTRPRPELASITRKPILCKPVSVRMLVWIWIYGYEYGYEYGRRRSRPPDKCHWNVFTKHGCSHPTTNHTRPESTSCPPIAFGGSHAEQLITRHRYPRIANHTQPAHKQHRQYSV